ncbi:MAG: hypothetical protein ACM3NQ_07340 [Bacteroidales bacterium]
MAALVLAALAMSAGLALDVALLAVMALAAGATKVAMAGRSLLGAEVRGE